MSSQSPAPRLSIGLRGKLLLVSLTLLAVPWVAYRYLEEMEAFLRAGQEEALLFNARAAATLMRQEEGFLRRHAARVGEVPPEQVFYAPQLPHPIQLDGYGEEWHVATHLARSFGSGDGGFSLALGQRDETLYALVRVEDDAIVYRSIEDPRAGEGDHLVIAALGPDAAVRRYLISTGAPGRLNAYLIQPDGGLRWEPGIRGEWQESAEGYGVELRLPLTRLGGRLSVSVADVDRAGAPPRITASAGSASPEALGVLVLPVAAIETRLAELAAPGARFWVVDPGGRVLAVAGNLAETQTGAADEGLLAGLVYRLLLPPPPAIDEPLTQVARLRGPVVEAALGGEALAQRRASAGGAVIAAAGYPIRVDGRVAGAVLVEQSTNAILTLQNRLLRNLVDTTVIVFGAVIGALLLFATRLSMRVRRLRNAADRAIAPDGRVRGALPVSRDGDEIGDLQRGLAAVLERLAEYNRYLEAMASRISHELRTPLAVVKSSLDNLGQVELSAVARPYAERAREGAERLETILARLREATRLEQALQEAEREAVPLQAFLEGYGEGYRLAYPQQAFTIDVGTEALEVSAVPDLLGQMLDKLVSNAVDFAAADTPVTLALRRRDGRAELSVSNQGPALPEAMRERLFDSMVSVREAKGGEPHLGVGLFIVRTVAEFHGGRVRAENRADGAGVVFTVELPLAPL